VEIARVRGYFRDVGIDLQEEHFTSGAQQTPLLASGQLDVGSTSVQSAHFNAVSRGVALQLVVDKGHLEPGANTQAVVLRADLVPGGEPPPIAEIRGRTMAISTDPKQGGTGFGLARMLATAGLTLDDVDWKLMPNRDMADFIANRGVEGAVLLEPFYTLSAQRTPLLLWGRLADYYPGMQIGAFAFGERFVLERPDVARRWMIANLRGVRDYYEWMRRGQPPDALGAILAESTGLPSDVVARVSWEAVNPDGYLNVDGLLTDQQQLVEWGAIRETLPVDRLVDHRFVEQALAEIGRYAG
jgi:NitT/TauT family transport system substrate-binding protein